jgi:hypothetical protein
MNELIIGGYYLHYKNKIYKVLSQCKISPLFTDGVIYQSQYDDKKIWLRPLDMFIGDNEEGVKRFTYMDIKDNIEFFKERVMYIYNDLTQPKKKRQYELFGSAIHTEEQDEYAIVKPLRSETIYCIPIEKFKKSYIPKEIN